MAPGPLASRYQAPSEGRIGMGTRTSCVDPKTGSLWTEHCSDGRRLLLRPFVVKIDAGYLITVPAGFVTDFSSIPSGVGWVMDWSKVDVAGVVHDWLYADGSLDRRKADRIWKDIALRGQHSANGLQAWLGRGALLLFGWRAWNRHRRHDSPVSPDEAPRAPDNDEELKNCADSLSGDERRNNWKGNWSPRGWVRFRP